MRTPQIMDLLLQMCYTPSRFPPKRDDFPVFRVQEREVIFYNNKLTVTYIERTRRGVQLEVDHAIWWYWVDSQNFTFSSLVYIYVHINAHIHFPSVPKSGPTFQCCNFFLQK